MTAVESKPWNEMLTLQQESESLLDDTLYNEFIKNAIIVSNYKAAKDFYVNKLGFSVIRENYRPERKDWKLDLRVNELTELEIFAEKNPPKRVNRPEACGLRHLAFCVDSVEQTVKELTEVENECESIRVDDYTGKKMTFFHDPDGLPLSFKADAVQRPMPELPPVTITIFLYSPAMICPPKMLN